MMLEAAEAMVAKNRTAEGRSGPVSLFDMGYRSGGVDEVGPLAPHGSAR